MSKKIWIAGVLTLVVALVAASVVAAAPVADPQNPPADSQGQQNGQGGPRGQHGHLNGEITAIGDGQITLQTENGREVVVAVSDATNYFGSLNSLSDLAVGDQITVAAAHDGQGGPNGAPDAQGAPAEPPSDGSQPQGAGERTVDAELIALSDELSMDQRSGGQITEITSSSLTIETRDGETLDFVINSDTVFSSHDDALQAISDLQVGDHIQVIYSESGSTLTAALIMAGGAPKGAGPNGQQNGAPQQDGNPPADSQQGTGAQG